AVVMARLAIAVRAPGLDPGEEPVTADVSPGRSAFVRLRLESDVVLTRGDRIILRAYSPPLTIAGGVVLDPRPARGGIRTTSGRARFAHLDADAAHPVDASSRACRQMLTDAGGRGVALPTLAWRLGLSAGGASAIVAAAEGAGEATRVADLVLASSAVDDLSDTLMSGLLAYHRARPLSDGMPREEARDRHFARTGEGVFERVLADLASAGKIVARDVLALATHTLALDEEEADAKERLERLYLEAFLQPPSVAEAALALGIRAEVADRIAQLLLRQRTLARVDTLVFHRESLGRLKADVAKLKAVAGDASATLDVAAFKDRYGVTRKFAIPLLEYLDRERVTRRVGDKRVVL
ncbi:MAG: SelB C-terminal domain-containing protein, partial [Acidobacteriota bacterium]